MYLSGYGATGSSGSLHLCELEKMAPCKGSWVNQLYALQTTFKVKLIFFVWNILAGEESSEVPPVLTVEKLRLR